MKSMRYVIDVIVLLLAAAVAHGGWLVADLFYPATDHPIHYRWAAQFVDAIDDGIWMPNWMPDGRGDLGEPVFVYYMPLFYYAVAAVDFLVEDIWLSIKVVCLVAGFLTGAALLSFCRQRGNSDTVARSLAFVAAAAPVLVMIRGLINAYPWFAATPFVVLCLISVVRIVERERTRDHALFALWVGLMSLTHTLTTVMMLYMLVAAAAIELAVSFKLSKLRMVVATGLSGLLGLALSATSLLPAVLLLDLVSPDRFEVIAGVSWRNTFTLPVFTDLWRLGTGWIAPSGTVVLIPVIVAATLAARPLATAERLVLLFAAISFLMSTELSYPVWAAFEAIQIVQRPFRFLVPFTFGTLVFAGLVLGRLTRTSGHGLARGLKLTTVICAGLAAMPSLALQADMLRARRAEPERYVVTSPALLDDLFYTDEHLPKTAGPGWKEFVLNGGWPTFCERLGAECGGGRITAHRYRWWVEVEKPTEMTFPLFAYPAWHVELDGKPVPYDIEPGSGLVTTDIPAGKHSVEARWQPLPVQRVGRWISAIAFAVIIMLWAVDPTLASRGTGARDP